MLYSAPPAVLFDFNVAYTVIPQAASTSKVVPRATVTDVDDSDDDDMPRNIPPSKRSRIIELSDGSDGDDTDGFPAASARDDEDSEGIELIEEPEESAEAELGESLLSVCHIYAHRFSERISKDWNSPIYIFFQPDAEIEYVNGRRVHVFECAAVRCMGKGNGRKVRRYLDTGDAKSTSNLRKHAKICWGEDAVEAADSTRDLKSAREALRKMKTPNGSITEAFQRAATAKVSYSHRQHTTTEAR